MTYENIGERFYANWYDPAAVAERERVNAEIHRVFDEARDRMRAIAEADELSGPGRTLAAQDNQAASGAPRAAIARAQGAS